LDALPALQVHGAGRGPFRKEKGVWKVGEGHIEDLVTKKANVQMTGINLVSRQDFNDEFAAWPG
jgi:hypothetical protein